MESNKYDNTNRWTLFRNLSKKSETSPDFSGELDVEGVTYFLDGWVKEGKVKKFFSGTIKKKDKQPEKTFPVIVDDIPF